jgi:hypothetical protein
MEEFTAEIIENLEQLPYTANTIEIQESQSLLLLGIKSNKIGRLRLP